jgi:hypothetical protein
MRYCGLNSITLPTTSMKKILVPDYTLYAKLIQQTDRNKRITQNIYTFQMSLV